MGLASSIGGAKSSVRKLRDDLKNSESKFNIESYLDKSEAGKYVSNLPGVKDIIKAIQDGLSKVFAFLGKILDILLQLLDWLDLNKILTALGLDKLLHFLFDLIANGFLGFGLPYGLRNKLLKFFKEACLDLSGSVYDNGFNRPSLEAFSLSALLIGLSCANLDNTYSTMYHTFMNNEALVDARDTRDGILHEIDVAKGTPVYVYDPNINDYIAQTNINTAEIQKLNAKLTDIESRITAMERDIDMMFANAVPQIITVLAGANPGDTDSTIRMIIDIATTRPGHIAGALNNDLSIQILVAINNTTNININNYIVSPSTVDTGTTSPIGISVNNTPKGYNGNSDSVLGTRTVNTYNYNTTIHEHSTIVNVSKTDTTANEINRAFKDSVKVDISKLKEELDSVMKLSKDTYEALMLALGILDKNFKDKTTITNSNQSPYLQALALNSLHCTPAIPNDTTITDIPIQLKQIL